MEVEFHVYSPFCNPRFCQPFFEDMKPMFVEVGEGDLVEINCLCWIPTDIIATQALERLARCPVLTFALVIQPASIDGTILELQTKR